MRRFSSDDDRSRVFNPLADPDETTQIQQGDWINLYQLLGVAPDASQFELDEKIIERGADAVYFAFSKNGKPAHIIQLEKHLPEMRPILLNPAVRRRYDEQLAMHANNDSRAVRYDDFLKTLDLRAYSGCMSALLFLSLPLLAWWFATVA